jgi:hypothetical protein
MCKTISFKGMMMKVLYLSVALFGLIGCSSTVVPPSQAKWAPAERIFKFQDSTQNKPNLIVIRDSGFGGAGCFASVYIDGVVAAKLDPGEKAIFYVDSGDRAVGAGLEGRGLCGASGERQERYITLKPNEHKYLRVFTSADGDMDIRPTTLN